ncbi:MAG TPA: efflux RND transporter periplasmic adaptor subunit [Candidatus Acidoferrum sp.]|jgi:HlyD family secretion protein|nr:efflux RND transporter periplasmic adaptor subunit [Candidatus Acidoferrum sp.]
MDFKRAAVYALGVTLTLSACSQGPQRQAPPLSVDVAAASRQNIATYVSLDGQVAPLEQSVLAFQQNGTITSISVNVGDRVRAGQVLARIDDSVLRAQAQQAQAQAQQQSATATGSQVGLPVQIQTNQATLQTNAAALSNAKLVYDQDTALYKDGYVSQAQLEAAHAAYVQAEQAYNTARIGLQNNVVSQENTKAAVAAAQAAAANARTLNTQVAQTTLYAPYDGVITQRLLDPGAYAGPSAPVLAVSRIDTLWININVPDTDLVYVRPGSQVSFTSSSLPGRNFQGRISTVNAVPTSGTLSYLARIQMQNAGDVLRGGMLVTATVPRESHAGAIVVPRSAVAQTENGFAVYVVGADNKAQEVPVRVGVQTDTLSEVISPKVKPGTQVITTRPDTLKDGSLVAVNSPSGASAPANGGNTSK